MTTGDKRGDICIYQSSVNPPHFKVLVDKEVTNIPKVRSSYVCTFSLELHLVDVVGSQ